MAATLIAARCYLCSSDSLRVAATVTFCMNRVALCGAVNDQSFTLPGPSTRPEVQFLETCSLEQVYTGLLVNVVFSLTIIGLNALILYFVHGKKVISKELDDASLMFDQSVKAAQFAKIPAIGVVAIADAMAIPIEEVLVEYGNDAAERRTVVTGILGKNRLTKRFLNDFHPQFLTKGYDEEEMMLVK
ncbi:hypothetical protein QR680_018668 [Steinernema hermaphroditum]|uniref:Uncharacterized protein n=1 Tax=Steinernema hermaphroditum TaxID=289476 RepID=A0AA39HIM8_9BILA|nr:hypothetical protein QR680_018668 [Steinernema hermaphroditum]